MEKCAIFHLTADTQLTSQYALLYAAKYIELYRNNLANVEWKNIQYIDSFIAFSAIIFIILLKRKDGKCIFMDSLFITYFMKTAIVENVSLDVAMII